MSFCQEHGGLVLDPFCGCGTTIDAAEKNGRDWIGIDVTQLAISLIKNRLQDTYGRRLKFISGSSRREEALTEVRSPKPEQIIIQVKGGKTGVKDVRGLRGGIAVELRFKRSGGHRLKEATDFTDSTDDMEAGWISVNLGELGVPSALPWLPALV